MAASTDQLAMKENLSKYSLDRIQCFSEKGQEGLIHLDLLKLRNKIAKKGLVQSGSICRYKLHSVKKFPKN